MKSVNIAVDGKYAEESAQEMIEDLREVLEKLGITVEITEGFHDTKYLSFRYDVDEIRKKAGKVCQDPEGRGEGQDQYADEVQVFL